MPGRWPDEDRDLLDTVLAEDLEPEADEPGAD